MSVTSIATYLPSSTQHNNVAFLGTTSRLPVAPTLTPIQEASLRAEQAAKQARDANERNVAWSVEEAIELTDLDAEGEDDPDYHDPVRKFDVQKPSLGVLAPLGLRNESGQIEPLVLPMDVDETYFGGVSEAVPTRLNDLVSLELIQHMLVLLIMPSEYEPGDRDFEHRTNAGYWGFYPNCVSTSEHVTFLELYCRYTVQP